MFVSVGVQGQQTGLLAFDIFVRNGSDSLQTVHPEKFYYVILPFPPYDSIDHTKTKPRTYAIDPEKQLMHLQKEIGQEKNAYSAMVAADLIVGFLGLVVDIASIGTPMTAAAQEKRDRQKYEMSAQRADHDYSYNQKLTSLDSQKEFWQTQTLRRTTLEPGQSVQGNVSFPISPKARHFPLFTPVGSSLNLFTFRQTAK